MFKKDFVMWQWIRTVSAVALVTLPLTLAGAEDLSRNDMRSLDGQVQEIKSDVLSIAAELGNLEERLLYPSSTQVAVFVSIDSDEEFRLDAIQLTIDGEQATHHIYSFKELEALQKGGVQRLFTGNLPTGDHEIGITVIGKLDNGKDFTASESFSFSKDVEPKSLGIVLAGSSGTAIHLANW